MPTFSIIIPTYNSEEHLKKALDSIQMQSFRDFEVVIMDGGSKDGTVALAKSFEEKTPELNIFTGRDKGIYDAMNKGIARSKGEWLLFLGSDDELYEETTLEEIHNNLNKPEGLVYYGDVMSERFDGRYDGEFTGVKLIMQNICHQAIVLNRKVFQRIGNYNLKFRSHADWDHNIRWFFHPGIRHQYIDVVVAHYADGGFSSNESDPEFDQVRHLKIASKGLKVIPSGMIYRLFELIDEKLKSNFHFGRYVRFQLLKFRYRLMRKLKLIQPNP